MMLVMVVMVVMVVMMRGRKARLVLAGAGAGAVAQAAAAADALDMMVMAHLRRSHLGFEAEHLGAVFAEPAVHVGVAGEYLRDAVARRFRRPAGGR